MILPAQDSTNQEPPDVGLAPTAVWRVPPRPPLQLEDPSLKPNPFPPCPLLPSSPTPLGSVCKALGGGGPGSRGGGVLRRKGVEGGGPPSGTWGQTHIWGYSNKGQAKRPWGPSTHPLVRLQGSFAIWCEVQVTRSRASEVPYELPSKMCKWTRPFWGQIS